MRYAILLALVLSSCSTPPPVVENRYLSLEEDQFLRDKCEQFESLGGCVVVPTPHFERLLRDLAKARAGRGT